MKDQMRTLIACFLAVALLTACGSKESPEMTQFYKNIDDFCNKVAEIDQSMNSLDADAETAVTEVLGYLDDLDRIFQAFAELDFPAEFDYLEATADEAGEYMSTAAASYREAYGSSPYNEDTAAYARENYVRACRRLQIIISFLRGETPEDVDLVDEE